MKNKCLLFLGAALLSLTLLTTQASAQVGVMFGRHSGVIVNLGVPPICPYGYYDYEPYECAPDGFYGPEFFYGGIFLGVGPWDGWGYTHGWGNHRFHGNRYGYRSDRRYRGHSRGNFRGHNDSHHHTGH